MNSIFIGTNASTESFFIESEILEVYTYFLSLLGVGLVVLFFSHLIEKNEGQAENIIRHNLCIHIFFVFF